MVTVLQDRQDKLTEKFVPFSNDGKVFDKSLKKSSST